ncbi:MAG TPA: potassium transporter Kup [Acidimicrobiales bacterium]|nr:potassium transporter Kup [Acidimicrobiales bacterium]
MEHEQQGDGAAGHGVAAGTAKAVLAVSALGVVYGDIGTNPLFAMREAFVARHHVTISAGNILGLLSLMFWSLLVVITLKYLTFVMRADNDGEGGIVALSALAVGGQAPRRGAPWVFLLVGLFGAALLYGDGMITPSISVLAAVEGTLVAQPGLKPLVIPAAVVILIGLFAVQHKGTAVIGRIFGPVMIVWFSTMAVLGGSHIVQRPGVLRAVWPGHAVSFFVHNGFTGFLVLGAVILVVVGGEALYADMGHFGRGPIAVGWYALVLPSLVLVYFGQGALLLDNPGAIENPFYRMAPDWALYPLVVLATLATVIASQALISGAFSLTHQAMQLGYCPRVKVRHTSETHIGQIYIPSVNWLLMVACIGLVLGFRHSASLAAAYGVAVTTTMVMTTALFFVVARRRLGLPSWLVGPVCAAFFAVDMAFFLATLFKIPEGGWFPLLVGAAVFAVLTTWRTGRLIVGERLVGRNPSLRLLVDSLLEGHRQRVPGTGAYLYATPGAAPPALLANLRHNRSLHEQVLVISIVTEKRPRVPKIRRAEITDLGCGFHQVVLHYGFLDEPDVPRALQERVVMHTGTDLDSTHYFVGREAVRVTRIPGMAWWRERLFAVLLRNATGAATYFKLPVEQTMEVGMVVEL